MAKDTCPCSSGQGRSNGILHQTLLNAQECDAVNSQVLLVRYYCSGNLMMPWTSALSGARPALCVLVALSAAQEVIREAGGPSARITKISKALYDSYRRS